MRIDWLALRELLGRYAQVFRHAWSTRHELEAPARPTYETEFLPAHLEIADTPVHPAPSWTMRAIAALATAVALLALFGHLDIVAVAHGKMVPSARVKIIQPAVTGVVRSILVQNGMHVVGGQLLMELDPAQAVADTNKATAAKTDAQFAVARAQALLNAQAKLHSPVVERVPAGTPERQAQIQIYAEGVYNEYRNKLSSLQAQLEQREAELRTARAEIAKLQVVAPLARQQADDYQSLAKEKYVSRDDYLDKEQSALTQEGELRAQTEHTIELSAAVEEQKQEIATTAATFRREQFEDMEKAQQALAQSSGDQTKAEVRQDLMQLRAPVSGTIQNLAIHTVGGVVTTAQALLEIVPEDTLEVEANVENKDIGFVEAGQDVVVKVEAFPYTRYGYLLGKVTSVSNDAVEDKKSGLLYVVRIALPTNRFQAGNKQLNFAPGMQVVAEIHTGKRTVAEYFFSPFVQTVGESLRER